MSKIYCTHCWHTYGPVLLTHPLQFRERCCHCGETRQRYDQATSTVKHGPFIPEEVDRIARDSKISVEELVSYFNTPSHTGDTPKNLVDAAESIQKRNQMISSAADSMTQRYGEKLKRLSKQYNVPEHTILHAVTKGGWSDEEAAARYLSSLPRQSFWEKLKELIRG